MLKCSSTKSHPYNTVTILTSRHLVKSLWYLVLSPSSSFYEDINCVLPEILWYYLMAISDQPFCVTQKSTLLLHQLSSYKHSDDWDMQTRKNVNVWMSTSCTEMTSCSSRLKMSFTWARTRTHTSADRRYSSFPSSAWVKAAGIGTVTFKDWLMWYRISNHITFKPACDFSLLPAGLQ